MPAEGEDPGFDFFEGSQRDFEDQAAVAVLLDILAVVPTLLFPESGDFRRKSDADVLRIAVAAEDA